jgi:V/A-type H+-transporting ATPase subunit K
MMKSCCWWKVVVLASLVMPVATGIAVEVGSAPAAADSGSVYRSVGIAGAAAFAVAVSILGASHAVGRIGSAALGAAAEKPELLTRSILFVALAEGMAVLGFAIAMMLVQKI